MKFTSKQKIHIPMPFPQNPHIWNQATNQRMSSPINHYFNFTRSNKFFNNYTGKNTDFCNSFSNMWNELPFDLRNKDMFEFNIELGHKLKPYKNKLYSIGSKFGNSIHTQLRVGRSQLNDHLFSVWLSPSAKCGNLETTEHFLLDCFLYEIERQLLFSQLPGVLEKSLDKYNRKELVHVLLHSDWWVFRQPWKVWTQQSPLQIGAKISHPNQTTCLQVKTSIYSLNPVSLQFT